MDLIATAGHLLVVGLGLLLRRCHYILARPRMQIEVFTFLDAVKAKQSARGLMAV